ncbi:MAG: hypothetical protein KAQ69_05350 [Spirochaetales bacterium]|nr:hypothetical protein [Spirochaetales bacterium]
MKKNNGSALKQWWNRYLERLANANQKSFGSQRLDCCDLNTNKSREQHDSSHSS